MTIERHDLVLEFPEYSDKIEQLRGSSAHFASLFDEYHAVDREVRHIEQHIETPSDVYTEDLKKRRVKLKDQLYAMLRA